MPRSHTASAAGGMATSRAGHAFCGRGSLRARWVWSLRLPPPPAALASALALACLTSGEGGQPAARGRAGLSRGLGRRRRPAQPPKRASLCSACTLNAARESRVALAQRKSTLRATCEPRQEQRAARLLLPSHALLGVTLELCARLRVLEGPVFRAWVEEQVSPPGTQGLQVG